MILEFSNFSFSCGDRKILDTVSFTAEEGEYICITGPNGAGKSTLLKCLVKIIKGDEGNIFLFGKDINDYPQKDLARLLGYVPQSTDQTFPFNVYEFISMGRYPYLNPFSRLTRRDIRVIDTIIELTELTAFTERNLNSLSGGERQRVYIAASLVQEPRVLLLDEPKNHLDPRHCQEVQKTLSEISSRLGITTIHVTHDLSHISRWSHKIIALKSGVILFEGKPDDIVTPLNLKKLFDTDFHTFKNPGEHHQIIVPFA